jgi:hypothetical protein
MEGIESCKIYIIVKITKAFGNCKNNSILEHVSPNVVKLQYQICLPFQWCPLH